MKTRNKFNHRALWQAMLAFILLTSALSGCTTAGPVENVVEAASLVQSDKPRQTAASPDEAHVPELVAGNTAFALDLYNAVFNNERNLFYSPHSLSMALAMTYLGARDVTEQQMAEALHYSLPQTQLHAAFNALDQALASRAETEDQAFRLHLVNAIWGQQNYEFLNSYLDALAENYGAGLRIVDFGQAEQARNTINQWVEEQTEQKIEELLPPASLNAETALVLTNAIYFKAAWEHAFPEDATYDGAFTLLDGTQVQVPLMQQTIALGYARLPGVQAVELPYVGGELSMVLLLPDTGTFEIFAQNLDSGKLDTVLRDLTPTQILLTMPKFSFDTELKLKETLMALGIVDAFGNADFSGIDGTRELFIDEVYHQAFVDVDEAGTEAAAATAVVMMFKGPVVEQELTLDHPFIFLIRDIETGAILFLGHVVNPVLG